VNGSWIFTETDCRVHFSGTFLFAAGIATSCALAGSNSISRPAQDWMISPGRYKASIDLDDGGRTVHLQNGLIRRSFRLTPNAATVDIRNLMTGETLVRAVRPEAVLRLNGKTVDVGGLKGQIEQAYLLPVWLDSLRSDTAAFQFAGFDQGKTEAPFPYHRRRWGMDAHWPPPGRSLTLHFHQPPGGSSGIEVAVHYELYDGIPLLCKWVQIRNSGSSSLRLNSFTSEMLAVVEPHWSLEPPGVWDRYNIHVESDYAFLGMTFAAANKTTFWVPDSTFTSQVDYGLTTPCVLECRPPIGPDADLKPGESFTSFRTFELFYDTEEHERKSLELRRMYRVVAPWVTENPIFMHLTTTNPVLVRKAVDQCVETGFEMIILSFGSGVNMETDDPAVITRMKELADYAHGRGIELGGYSLLASRQISNEDDVIDSATGRPGGAAFGHSPCLGSKWGIEYLRKIRSFIEKTGFDVLEHDGSYPGDVCASTTHPGHRGLYDSQWKQWSMISDFYRWCRARNVYLNVPDWYFLSGSSKTGVGYREVNWSLPRDRQIILGRQNIFDGTWYKTPSMGWTFVPLVEYHGGGAAATLEPLCEHLEAYKAHLVQNFGSGVQACYRGTRLYDTDSTHALVKRWVDWYRKHRAILNSDIVHIRRADGRNLDCMLHVNASQHEKGLLMVYNPTAGPLTERISVPLYYTGMTGSALVREQEGKAHRYALDSDARIHITATVGGHSHTWFLIE
jgi:hypothetical protein